MSRESTHYTQSIQAFIDQRRQKNTFSLFNTLTISNPMDITTGREVAAYEALIMLLQHNNQSAEPQAPIEVINYWQESAEIQIQEHAGLSTPTVKIKDIIEKSQSMASEIESLRRSNDLQRRWGFVVSCYKKLKLSSEARPQDFFRGDVFDFLEKSSKHPDSTILITHNPSTAGCRRSHPVKLTCIKNKTASSSYSQIITATLSLFILDFNEICRLAENDVLLIKTQWRRIFNFLRNHEQYDHKQKYFLPEDINFFPNEVIEFIKEINGSGDIVIKQTTDFIDIKFSSCFRSPFSTEVGPCEWSCPLKKETFDKLYQDVMEYQREPLQSTAEASSTQVYGNLSP